MTFVMLYKMKTVNVFSAVVMLTLLSGGSCNSDVQLLNERLDIMNIEVEVLSARCTSKFNSLSNRLTTYENKMSIDNALFRNEQDERLLSLKNELKTDLQRHVKTALSEILRSESFEDIIKSEVVSEMRHLKRTNHQMRTQLHQMMTSLGQVRKDNRVYGEALLKGERENAELMSCSKSHFVSELLTVQLAERDRLISELKQQLMEQNGSCTPANSTNYNESDSVIDCSGCLHSEVVTRRLIEHDHQISKLNHSLMAERKLSRNSDSVLETTKPTNTILSTTTTETITPRPTTPDPQEERSRILVAPMWSSSSHQFRQLNFHNNSLDNYSYLNLKSIDSVVYISKLNSLVIGISSPYKIISSKLHTSRVVTVRHNVRTWGMAADEKRGIIFLTTIHPSWTISRMSLQGRHYTTVVNLVGYGDWPRGIAVHPDTQMIYSCNGNKLFSVRYDGSSLTTLDTGNYIKAVTLDISNSLLHYSKYKKLMKMSLSTNTTIEVTEFSFNIWNLLFYRDTVYYISYARSPGILGAVGVVQNSVSYTLQTLKVSGVKYFAICLIP